jgi:hypothetical protein
MKRMTRFAAVAALTVLSVAAATHVRAQESNVNDVTVITFNNPVEMPGVTLEPGSYIFRLAETPSRNVVQVFKKDNRDVVGQWTFVQADRPRATDETLVMFKETGGTRPAVQYWYFPGEKIGKEFVYPKDQARRIAARTGQTVQSDDGPVTAAESAVAASSTRGGEPVSPVAAPASPPSDRAERPEREGSDPAVSEAARAAADIQLRESERQVAVDQQRSRVNQDAAPRAASPPAADRPVAQGQVARAELPDTASPLPLSALIGLASLAGAGALRALRRS